MDVNSEKLLARIVRNTRLATLATLRDGAPLVSMVAYVPVNDFSLFYIHVSRLAQHTVDMQKDKRVGLMIVETDDGRADPQTLARIAIRGSAELLPPGQPGYTPARSLYLERFPESAPLFKLADFEMWRIIPKGARYIAGLAKAYNLTPESLEKASKHST
jgi:putative heme iron utilization protein